MPQPTGFELRRTWPFELGLNLPFVEGQMDGDTPRWSDIRAMAEVAEEIGFDAVWVSDHVGFEQADGGWHGAWESWTLLSALGAATTRVMLGTYVTAAPFRNPALLAKMAETLDEVSAGRVILGLGAGWNEPEFRAYGFPFEDRFDRFEDALRVITSMVRTGTATLDGPTTVVADARIRPRGPRPAGLPIMIGAAGPRMLRLTAELGDQWNAGMRTAEEVGPLLAAMDEACRAVGRDPASLGRSLEVLVRTIPRDAGRLGDDASDREVGGSPEAIAAELAARAALGFDHLQIQLRPNSLEGVRAFAPVIEALGTQER